MGDRVMSGKIRLKGASSGYIDITAPDSGANTTLNVGRLQEKDSSGDISTGNITTTGYIRGPATFTIDPANHGDSTGTLRVLGNLTVDGTTTTINSTTVTTADKNIVIAQGAADSAATDGAGISVDVVDASLTFQQSVDEWSFNRRLFIHTDTTNQTYGPTSGGSYGLTIEDASTDSDSICSIKFNSTDAGGVPRHLASIAAQKTGQWAGGGGSYPGSLTFWTRPTSGSQVERMRIDEQGNVMFGYAGVLLDSGAKSIISYKDHYGGNTHVGYIGTGQNNSQASNYYTMGDSGSTVFRTYNGSSYSHKMTIKSDGNVGIGTGSPSNKLHVNGDLLVQDSATFDTMSLPSGFRIYQVPGATHLTNMGGGSTNGTDYDGATAIYGGVTSQQGGGFVAFGQDHATNPGCFKIHTSSGLTMHGDSTGNVGIGTASPSNKLHVNGDLLVQDSAQFNSEVAINHAHGSATFKATTQSSNSHSDFLLHCNQQPGNARFILSTLNNNQEWEFFHNGQNGKFGVYNGTNSYPALQIDSSGNTFLNPDRGGVFVGTDMSTKDLNNLSNILGVKNAVLDYYEFSNIKKTALYHNAYYTSGGKYRSPEIGGYGRLEIYSDSDTQNPQLLYRHGIASGADSNHAVNNPEVMFGVDSVGTTVSRRGLVVGTNAELSEYRTVNYAGITMRGGTSDALLGVQDGNGRIQLKWNATNGTNEKYLVSNEQAFMWDLNILSDPIWEMKYAGAGTADSAIPWETLLQLESTGTLEAEDEVIGVVKRVHLKQTSNATSITNAATGYFTWNTQTKIDTDTYTHSTSTDADNITIRKAGLYNIIGNFTFGNAASSARNTVRVRVRVNGTAINSTMSYDYDRGLDYGEFSNNKLNTVLDLAADDVVDVEWYGQNIDGTCTWHGDQSELIIMRIGKSS
jgi:hypothetical protein